VSELRKGLQERKLSELQGILEQHCTGCDDHDFDNCHKCAEMYEQLSAHVQREVVSAIEQAAQFVEKNTPYLEGVGSVGVPMAAHIRSLAKTFKPYAEMVAEERLEAQAELLGKFPQHAWPDNVTYPQKWGCELRNILQDEYFRVQNERRDLRKIEAQRAEARKGGSRT
jgi:hypothetical protein